MSRSTEVATRESSDVPDLVRTPAATITADDITLSKVYVAQFISTAVQNDLVKAGDIYAATDQDDPEPEILVKKGAKTGLIFYVLGIRKGRSRSVGGELEIFDYDDPNAPADASVTYNYTIAVPSVDDEVPMRMLMKRSGAPAARKINTVIMKHAAKGPSYDVAFELTSAERSNEKGKYFVPQVKQAVADPKVAETVQRLALLASTPANEARGSAADEPAI